jgi:hypothetical protein
MYGPGRMSTKMYQDSIIPSLTEDIFRIDMQRQNSFSVQKRAFLAMCTIKTRSRAWEESSCAPKSPPGDMVPPYSFLSINEAVQSLP